MTKRMLWYVCLGLLCCGALAIAVNGSGVQPQHVTATAVKHLSKPAALATPEESVKKAAPADQPAQAQFMTLREAQTATPEMAAAQSAYQRWLVDGTATPEEKALMARYIFSNENVEAPRSNPLDAQGTDGFYRYVDNTGGDTATYSWVELCGDPNATDGPTGDDVSMLATIGWNFPMYGGSYGNVNICTNGILSFTTANCSFSNACISTNNPSANSPQIMPYWDDLYAAASGGCNANGTAPWIRFKNDGGTRFIVQWTSVNFCCGANADISFEAILYPSGCIKFQYGRNGVWNDATQPNSATIGVDVNSSAGYGSGLEYRCNATGNTQITAGRAIWFCPVSGPPPIGQCCYNSGANCSDTTATRCAQLGGNWTLGQTCAGNPCPQLPPNDNCVNVTPVPCPINATGNNALATHDCPLLTAGQGETWHAFTLAVPSDVTITECGATGTWQNFYIVVAVGCPCSNYLFYTTYTYPYAGCPASNGIQLFFAALPAGTYYYPVLRDDALGSTGDYTINIVCNPVVIGRCCYQQNNLCADNTLTACNGLGGTWTQGLSCSANPCPPPPPCIPDFTLNAPGSVSGNTTGQPDECGLRAGPDQIVQVNIPSAGNWTFDICDPTTNWDSYIYLSTSCCSGVIAQDDDACPEFGVGLSMISCFNIPAAGTYWVDIEGFSSTISPTYQGPWTLHVTQCAPHKCCYGCGANQACVDTTAPGCAALGGIYDASTTCAANPCVIVPTPPNDLCQNAGGPWFAPATVTGNNAGSCHDCPLYQLGEGETWEQVVTTQTCDLTIDFCGTTPAPPVGWNDVYIILLNGCPCQSAVFANNWNETECADGNWTVHWLALPPGTYYYPVLREASFQSGGPYTLHITSPCQPCSSATQTTVYRNAGPANSVDIRWFANQTFGRYQVWRTSNKNNDHDPNNGSDPDWALISTLPAPAVPGFMSVNDAPLAAYYNYVVVHDCAPIGRCCYGDPLNPSCADNTEAQCTALTGSWTANASCSANPCPIVLNGDDACGANNPLLTNGLAVNGSTVGATTDGTWPCAAGGSEVWYRYTGNAAGGTVTVSLCGSGYDTAVMVLDGCGGTNLACNDDFCGLQSQTTFVAAPNTTYWIAVGGFAAGTGSYMILVTQ